MSPVKVPKRLVDWALNPAEYWRMLRTLLARGIFKLDSTEASNQSDVKSSRVQWAMGTCF